MAMGRELYGFPKSMGTISIPPSPEEATELWLDTLVVKKYPPLSKAEVLRLVQVRQSARRRMSIPARSALGMNSGTWSGRSSAFLDNELDLFEDIRLFIRSMDDLLHLRIPMLFLKQFRDVVQPQKAAYQAIVETTPFSSRVHEGRILGSNYDVIVERCDSHPICAELRDAAAGALRPKSAFT